MFRNFRLKRVHKAILLTLAGLLLLGFIIFFAARGWILDRAVASMKSRLKNKYALTLNLDSYRLEGFSHLRMQDISCLTAGGDTLMAFRKVDVVVKPWAALLGRVRLSDIQAERGMLHLSRLKAVRSKMDEPVEETDTTRFGRVKKYVRYLKKAAALVPDEFNVAQMRMYYQDSLDNIEAYVDSLTYDDEDFTTTTVIKFKGRKQLWRASGTFDKNSLETHMQVRTTGTTFHSFNFIKKLARADIGFRAFTFDLEDFDDSRNEIHFEGGVNARNVYLYSPRLSKDTVRVAQGGMKFDMTLTPEHLTLQESRVLINGLEADIAAHYIYKPSAEAVSFRVRLPRVPAQKIINAMPQGTFEKTRGLQLAGDMRYKLDFYLDLHEKDTVHINSDPEGYGLRVLKYGEADLSKLNTAFTYYPYNSKRGIVVGPENPSFAALEEISPLLRSAVLTNEDPSFFRHKGFVEESFEQSFLQNLRAGRFERGASTISMQLVKNVFLSHEKTIDRKLEESFLVWLLENLRVSSKHRMFEVYLNIIEWGPGVYGAEQAAQFYFSKPPAYLSLNEAIYLAIIIPKPRAFAWRFDEQGNLKDYAQRKVSYIARIMERRGLASVDSAFSPDVYISGPARSHIRIVPDSTLAPADTLEDAGWPARFLDDLKGLFRRKDRR